MTSIEMPDDSQYPNVDHCFKKIEQAIKLGDLVLAKTNLELLKPFKIPYWFAYCKIQMYSCGAITEQDRDSILRELDEEKFPHNNERIEKQIQFLIPTVNSNPEKRVLAKDHGANQLLSIKLPMNFSWISPSRVCGSGIISTSNHRMLQALHINQVITLTEERLPLEITALYPSITFHHFPVPDRNWTNLEDLQAIVGLIVGTEESAKSTQTQSEQSTLVHCLGGVGRTNTVLAAYLLSTGAAETPSQAIAILKSQRKCILSGEQVQALQEFKQSLRTSVTHERQHLHNKGYLPKVIMMVGAPASGKSTLSQRFVETYGPQNVVHLTQDDLGKKEVQAQFSKNLKRKVCILLDRCNLTRAERKEWIDQLLSSSQQIVAVHFDLTLAMCEENLKSRKVHSTLAGPSSSSSSSSSFKSPSSSSVLTAEFQKMEPPLVSEGFARIFTVKSVKMDSDFHEINQYFHLNTDEQLNEMKEINDVNQPNPNHLKSPTDFIKFPRTRHLYSIGSATRDDLIMSSKDSNEFIDNSGDNSTSSAVLIIDEKIDGCSLGISIDQYGIIQVQNRSQFGINSGYHPQFALLDVWIADHEQQLREVLRPNRDILFGEWVYAQHSLKYTALPDYFIAYDLYDCHCQQFLDRQSLIDRLESSKVIQSNHSRHSSYSSSSLSIQMVHTIISNPTSISKESILQLVNNTKSVYYDGPVEGLYLRKCRNGITLDRCKLVRKDFKGGNDEWNKNSVVPNTFAFA